MVLCVTGALQYILLVAHALYMSHLLVTLYQPPVVLSHLVAAVDAYTNQQYL
jgi:hypothetical protein